MVANEGEKMKKIYVILLAFVLLTMIFNCLSLNAQSKDPSYELSKDSYRIFDNLYKRDELTKAGVIYVDFINPKDKDTIDVQGRTVEMDFITNSLRKLSESRRIDLKVESSTLLSSLEINEVFSYVDSNESENKSSAQEQYKELLTEDFVNLLIDEFSPDEILDDRIEEPQRGDVTYTWYPVYYGSNYYYDSNYTYYGNYTQYSQYYKEYVGVETLPWNTQRTSDKYVLYETTAIPYGNKLGETTAYTSSKPYDFYDTSTLRYYVYKSGFLGIGKKHEIYNLYKEVEEYSRTYTGVYYYALSGNPQRYAHQQKIVFSYQSYNMGFHAPQASITLIKDYFGDQKMVLVSTDPEIGVYTFYITQEIHYKRNEWYQIGDYQMPLTTIYPTLGSLFNSGAPWNAASNTTNYFHRLLNNQSNVKYQLPIVYYDGTVDALTTGEFELVYNNTGSNNQSPVVTDSFLAGTFNFGCDSNFANGTGLVNASHYIRDVYPYLIWGNSLSDYQNHTPFERFVWDKDSANVLGYNGQNLSGYQLTSLYPGTIGNQRGTAIPTSVQNGQVLFQ